MSNHSQVDESLFGQPNHVSKRQNGIPEENTQEITLEELARQRSAKRNSKKTSLKGKETVQVITKDLIRNLMYVN